MSENTSRHEPNPILGLRDPHNGETGSSDNAVDRQRTGTSNASSVRTAIPFSSGNRRASINVDDNSIAHVLSSWMTAESGAQSENHELDYNSFQLREGQVSDSPPANDPPSSGLYINPAGSNVEADNLSIFSSDSFEHSNETGSSRADTRIGPTPRVDHKALKCSLSGAQLRAVQNLIAHQELLHQ